MIRLQEDFANKALDKKAVNILINGLFQSLNSHSDTGLFFKKAKKWKSQILNFFIKAFASPKTGVQYPSETNYVKFTTKWSEHVQL